LKDFVCDPLSIEERKREKMKEETEHQLRGNESLV